MSEEHDSWFKSAFGVDLGESVNRIKDQAVQVVDQAADTVGQVVQGVQKTVEGAVNQVTSAAVGVVKKIAAAAGSVDARNAGSAGPPGGGKGTFPLGGSVGRGGGNAANDVRAVQAALGIGADGQCGPQTIAAIEAFQRGRGQAKPDGRVDAGGGTERALTGGAKPAPTSAAPAAATDSNESGSLLDQFQGVFRSAEASVQSTLQSAQDSAFEAAGVSPETAQTIREGQQAIADFQKGRDEGRASGSLGLINMLPPVQFVKAASRISEADDGAAEAQKIAGEKFDTAVGIGKFFSDPAASGTAIGESLAKDILKADQEGRKAEFVGRLVGEGDVIAATVAVGGAAGGLEAGGARGVAAGVESGGARGLAAGAEEGGVVIRAAEGVDAGAPTLRAPAFGEPIPPTLRSPTSPLGEPISPLAESVPGSRVGRPIPLEGPPTELPPPQSQVPRTLPSAEPISPLAESVRPPNVAEPIPSTELPAQGVPQEPFNPSPSFEVPPDTFRTPGIEPFDPAPSFEPPPDTIPSRPLLEPFDPAPSAGRGSRRK